jgi:transketolase
MIRLREGRDVTIIATGNIVATALAAADTLAAQGVGARVLDCHTVKPLDEEAVLAAAAETAGIVTAEDHNVVGGLGSAVCELLAERGPAAVRRVGLADKFASSGRDYRKLLAHYGLDSKAIVGAAGEVLAAKCLAQASR